MRRYWIGLASAALLTPALALSEPLNLTLAGASPGGLWSLIGLGVDRAVKADEPESGVTYQTSGGGYANIKLLEDGLVDMAILHDAEAAQAVAGLPPFTTPITSLRALAVVYDFSALQPVASAEFLDAHGIASFDDIREKKPPLRLALNKRGNITHDLAVAVLGAYGITVSDIEAWGGRVLTAGSKEGAELMKNRQVDMTMNAPFVGHSSITQVASALPIRMMPMSDTAIADVRSRMGIGQTIIPASAYDWLDEDRATPALAAMIAVRSDAPEPVVRQVAEALVRNIDALSGVHNAMQALTPQMMIAQQAIPFHPAALSVFEAAGIR